MTLRSQKVLALNLPVLWMTAFCLKLHSRTSLFGRFPLLQLAEFPHADESLERVYEEEWWTGKILRTKDEVRRSDRMECEINVSAHHTTQQQKSLTKTDSNLAGKVGQLLYKINFHILALDVERPESVVSSQQV